MDLYVCSPLHAFKACIKQLYLSRSDCTSFRVLIHIAPPMTGAPDIVGLFSCCLFIVVRILCYQPSSRGPGQRSRYSDSLRAGQSGDRIPVEARLSAPVQTGPGVHPASCTMGTGSFPGVKRPGRGVDHPLHLVPKLKKE